MKNDKLVKVMISTSKCRIICFSVCVMFTVILFTVYTNQGWRWVEGTGISIFPLRKSETCENNLRRDFKTTVRSNGTMVAILVLECQPGYMGFTSPFLLWIQKSSEVHVFSGGNSCHTRSDFEKNYGKDFVHHELEPNETLLETTRQAISYFLECENDAQHLILATPDVLFTESAGYAFSEHSAVDLLTSIRTESSCDDADVKTCSEYSPRLMGSQISKSLAVFVKENPLLLQSCGRRDVMVVKISQLKILSPEESFSIRIGQEFVGQKCSRYVETLNFDRCDLSVDVQKGIEFYLEKCNKPSQDFFDDYLDFNEVSIQNPVMYSRTVISFSLYGGNNPRYIDGALENSELVGTIFPGWRMWVFYDESIPDNVVHTLCSRGVKLVKITDKIKNMRAWRFAVASAPVERFLVRDIDSRLSIRESEAVKEWIKSGKKFHLMRDHPCHTALAINAGLWGATGDAIPNLFQLMKSQKMDDYYLQDTHFLNSVVWPIARQSVYQHDAFPNLIYGDVHPFPTKRIGVEHVGSVIVGGSMRPQDIKILVDALVDPHNIYCG